MALTFQKPESTPEITRDRPSLTPKQAQEYTGGAITYEFLKNDRLTSDANGTSPLVPFYKFGHRSIKYCPSDLDSYIDSQRIS